MAVYQLLHKLENLPFYNKLFTTGIVPMIWLDYKLIYEFYLEELKSQKKVQAITNTAEEFNLSERSIYSIIRKMK
ncbi:hypothetical protein INR75_19685 [Zunongwangia sp. SCSIO 43204]|uniref:hypothetical protein n=1 Tax=Zunongwangia sp. SCSIO 43204 TaxID=2779359 RepID=UPI001CAA0776|nr:hypothetical protein [Zunongwangia sp. SCSIO 43204]UAB84346.1 hypothetical protein INR75_19685 [Zunongwangia sp. SCSIO 43204]